MEQMNYPALLPESTRPICTEDFFFPQREFAMIRALSFQNYEIGMHVHDFYEINIVLNGSGVHYVADRTYQLRRGQVFVIPPNLRHGYYNCGDLEVFHILVSLRFLNRYRTELSKLDGYVSLFNIHPILRINTNYSFFLELSSEEMLLMQETLNQLLEASKGEQSDFQSTENDLLLCMDGMKAIVCLCAAYRKKMPNSSDSLRQTEKHEMIADGLQYIYENYNKKILFEELAQRVHLSYSAYERLFRDTLGISPAAFVTECRLTEAKRLLKNTKLSVTEIAQRVGFYDSSHFYRTFQKYYQISPSRYRNAQENKKT